MDLPLPRLSRPGDLKRWPGDSLRAAPGTPRTPVERARALDNLLDTVPEFVERAREGSLQQVGPKIPNRGCPNNSERTPVVDSGRTLMRQLRKLGITTPDLLAERCALLVDLRWEILCYGHVGRHSMERTRVHSLETSSETLQKARILLGNDPLTGRRTDFATGQDHRPPLRTGAFLAKSDAVFAEHELWESKEAYRKRSLAERQESHLINIYIPAKRITGNFHTRLFGFEMVDSEATPPEIAEISFTGDSLIVGVYHRHIPEAPWSPVTLYPAPADYRRGSLKT